MSGYSFVHQNRALSPGSNVSMNKTNLQDYILNEQEGLQGMDLTDGGDNLRDFADSKLLEAKLKNMTVTAAEKERYSLS